MRSNLIGQKFGRLTPIKCIGRDKYRNALWICKCDCGNEKIVNTHDLKSGDTKSCGCLKKEGNNLKHGHKKIKTSRTYNTWHDMVQRCTNPNNIGYKYYGGKVPPVIVCDRWSKPYGEGFKNFLKDMGERPKNKTLDRINNDLGYYKENCCWATPKEQARNRKTNVLITFRGEIHILVEWAEILGIKYNILYQRIYKYNWSIEKAFTTPVKRSI